MIFESNRWIRWLSGTDGSILCFPNKHYPIKKHYRTQKLFQFVNRMGVLAMLMSLFTVDLVPCLARKLGQLWIVMDSGELPIPFVVSKRAFLMGRDGFEPPIHGTPVCLSGVCHSL